MGVAASAFPFNAQAAVKVWVGTGTGDLTTTDNWNPTGLPGQADLADFEPGGFNGAPVGVQTTITVPASPTNQIRQAYFNALPGSAPWTIDGPGTLQIGRSNSSGANNFGTIRGYNFAGSDNLNVIFNANVKFTSTTGESLIDLQNTEGTGSVHMVFMQPLDAVATNGTGIRIQSGTDPLNTVKLTGGIAGTNGKDFVQTGVGTVTLGGTSAGWSRFYTANGGTLIVTGTDTGTLNTVPFTFNDTSTVRGTGTISRPLVMNNGSTFAPGLPATPGTLTVSGLDLSFSGSVTGEYRLDALGGTSDLVNLTQDLYLAGNADLTFEVSVLNGLTLPDGDYPLINYNSVTLPTGGSLNYSGPLASGQSALINLSSNGGPGALYLHLETVPEPSSMCLIGIGLLSIGILRKRVW